MARRRSCSRAICEPGTELVTNVTTGNEAVRTQPGFGGFPPFMGPGGRGGDRGGGPGGNRGGGGGNNRGGGRTVARSAIYNSKL